MTSNTRPAVGFIGLGDQGLPMALAIAEAGYPLHAWARRAGSLDALAPVAYTGHADIAQLAASSDIVCLCVSTDDDVMALLTGGLRQDSESRVTGTQRVGYPFPFIAVR